MHQQCRVAVLGRRFSGLLEFWRKLNGAGFFNVTLRDSPEELMDLLEAGECFDVLFFDGFESGRDIKVLESIDGYRSIDLITLVADVNSLERRKLLLWAHQRCMASLQVLQFPIRQEDLELMILRPLFNSLCKLQATDAAHDGCEQCRTG